MSLMSRPHHARYSAWSGQTLPDIPSPEHVLEALSDSILSDGVDHSVSRALHQGIEGDDLDSVAGLDQLRDRLRAAKSSAVDELASLLNDDLLSDPAALPSDEDLRKMLSALSARAASFPGMVNDATPGVRAEFESLLQASAPGQVSASIAEMLDHIIDLSAFERQLRGVRSVEDIADLDYDLLSRVLGSEAGLELARLERALREFRDSGYVNRQDSRTTLSSRAVQKVGETLLQQTVVRLRNRGWGEHVGRDRAHRHEPTGLSRDYQFGDPFELDLGQSLGSAIRRRPGTPLHLSQHDFKIVDRESSQRATTVLAIDLSRSMGERGYLLAAKRLALALSTYARKRYPHDELQIIGFSESARAIQMQELVDLRWDRYGFGTNVHDALRVANGILAGHRGRKRNVVLITDGEPTAHRDASGNISFNHPPSPETIARTFQEAARLRREGIYLCVCLMSATPEVGKFGRELARHAAGDVIVTDPEELSADLVVTYAARRG
jgi:uncharacterized protein with von Willebrand factor type A (vWA) domain